MIHNLIINLKVCCLCVNKCSFLKKKKIIKGKRIKCWRTGLNWPAAKTIAINECHIYTFLRANIAHNNNKNVNTCEFFCFVFYFISLAFIFNFIFCSIIIWTQEGNRSEKKKLVFFFWRKEEATTTQTFIVDKYFVYFQRAWDVFFL